MFSSTPWRPKADSIGNSGTAKIQCLLEKGLGSILGPLQGYLWVCDSFSLDWCWLFYEVDVTLPDVQGGKWLRNVCPQALTISRGKSGHFYLYSVCPKPCQTVLMAYPMSPLMFPIFHLIAFMDPYFCLFFFCCCCFKPKSYEYFPPSLWVTSSKGKNLFSNVLLCTWPSPT